MDLYQQRKSDQGSFFLGWGCERADIHMQLPTQYTDYMLTKKYVNERTKMSKNSWKTVTNANCSGHCNMTVY